MNQKGFTNILIGIITAVFVAGAAGYLLVSKQSPTPEVSPESIIEPPSLAVEALPQPPEIQQPIIEPTPEPVSTNTEKPTQLTEDPTEETPTSDLSDQTPPPLNESKTTVEVTLEDIPEEVIPPDEPPAPISFSEPEIYGDAENKILVTFSVTVPDKTLADDSIYLVVDEYMPEINGEISRGIPMTKTGNQTWAVIYRAPKDQEIRYRYNRNDNDRTDEILNDWRNTSVASDSVSVNDIVTNWLWVKSDMKPNNAMTFTVRVPENTPEGDTIYLYTYIGGKFPMQKTSAFTHTVTVNFSDLEDKFVGIPSDMTIWYIYGRNGRDYNTAEYVIPDDPNLFWERPNRTAFFEPDGLQEDTVGRWRWFPDGPIPQEDISEFVKATSFPSRINDTPFRSGQGITDAYFDPFDDFLAPTARHMVDTGYKWVVFFPAWDWIDDDPWPEIATGNPPYPDEKLLLQMKTFKDAGLKVILAPQICCTNIDDRNNSTKWWTIYFDEIERFLIHYAELAEEAGADAFFADVASIGLTEDQGLYVVGLEQIGWSDAWDRVREVYSGEIGQMIWNLGAGTKPPTEFVTWAEKLDFFYVQQEDAITLSTDPTKEELISGVEREIAEAKMLYNLHGKPVILQTGGYHSIKNSWHGHRYYPLGLCGEEEPDTDCSREFSSYDQARVIDAFFEVIKDNPWIVGYFHFGYAYWDLPLGREWNIRGKTAERVWQKWNKIIYSDTPPTGQGASTLEAASRLLLGQLKNFLSEFHQTLQD